VVPGQLLLTVLEEPTQPTLQVNPLIFPILSQKFLKSILI